MMELQAISPFEPIHAAQVPQGSNWVAQVKWDGVRMLTYYDGRQIRLINRNLNDRTLQYPELHEPRLFSAASSFILDGELIAFNQTRPSFHEIMRRDRMQKKPSIELAVNQVPVTYMVFDILFYDGRWTTEQTLAERQALLERILIPQKNIQLVQNFADATGLLNVMKQHQMEGIVVKDLDSTYLINGKDKRWQKLKIFHDLYAVVGGVTFRHNVVNALMLGLYEGDRLIYIGHAGTGKLSSADWRELTERIKPLIRSDKPFANEPERSKEAVWLKPEIAVKVQFMEWTTGRTMRHPSIQAFVSLPLSECTFLQLSK